MRKSKFKWNLCVLTVVCIIVMTYSPLVILPGKITPFFFGLPYTLWITILLTIVLVVLTYIGGKVIPHDEEDES